MRGAALAGAVILVLAAVGAAVSLRGVEAGENGPK